MTLAEGLQFTNLVLIPILVYVVRLERRLVIFEVKGEAIDKSLESIDKDIRAVHKRLDHYGMPHASSRAQP